MYSPKSFLLDKPLRERIAHHATSATLQQLQTKLTRSQPIPFSSDLWVNPLTRTDSAHNLGVIFEFDFTVSKQSTDQKKKIISFSSIKSSNYLQLRHIILADSRIFTIALITATLNTSIIQIFPSTDSNIGKIAYLAPRYNISLVNQHHTI